jgi:signal transduction histidine kinase
MGSLLAGVAHELNNPLAILLAQATLLRDKAQNDDLKRRAERIYAAAERSGRIVKSFLALARQKPPRREEVDLNAVAAGAIEMLGYGLRSNGIEVELSGEADLPPSMQIATSSARWSRTSSSTPSRFCSTGPIRGGCGSGRSGS